MARLPDPYGQRETPRSNARVLNYGEANQSGVAEIGNVISHIGKGIAERERELSVGRARNSVLLEQAKVLTELKDEPDYTKHEQIYSERMQKVRESAGKDLSPYAQEMLTLEFDRADQQGKLAVHENARRMQGIKAVADLEQSNYDLSNAAISAPSGTEMLYIEQIGRNIQNALNRGDINPVEAGRQQRTVGRGIVMARAERIKDTTELMAYLGKPEGDLLTAEDKVKLIEARQQDNEFQAARDFADSVRDKYGDDFAAVNAAIAKHPDARIRAQAQSFATNDFALKRTADAEARANAFNGFADIIATSTNPPEAFLNLSRDQPLVWASLHQNEKAALEKLSMGDEVANNNLLFDNIMTLAQTDRKAALDLLNSNPGSFSASTFQTLRNKLSTDVEAKDALTVIQRIKNVTGKDKPDGEIYLQYEQRLLEEQSLGKPVTQERKNQIIENLIVESSNWGTDPTYEMGDNNKRDEQFEVLDMFRAKIIRETGVVPDKEALGSALAKYEDELAEIRKEFKLRGVKNPSDKMVKAKWKLIRG